MECAIDACSVVLVEGANLGAEGRVQCRVVSAVSFRGVSAGCRANGVAEEQCKVKDDRSQIPRRILTRQTETA